MTQPDMTEVLDGLQDLRDRQIDLTPVHEELRELRGSQPDVASVIDALDALQASLPAQFRELEGRLLDVSAFADSLDQLVANQPDVQPVVQAVAALRAEVAERAEPAGSAVAADQLEPLLTEIRSLRLDPPDLTPVIEAIDTLRAEVPDLGATTEAVAELRRSLGDSLHERLEGLMTAALDRQQTESQASRHELRAIDDHLAPIADALQSVTDRLGTIEAVTSDQAERLAQQSAELIGLRSDTSGLARSIPDAVTRLDVLAEEVRSVSAGTAEPAAVMEQLGLISTELDHISRLRETERAELAALLDGLAEVRSRVGDVLTHVAAAPAGTEIDLGPSLAALDERLSALMDAQETDQAPTADLAQRIERLMNDGMGDIDRAVAARQLEHQSVVSGLIGSIPDPTPALEAIGASIADRDRETSADLVARLDSLADRTDGGLQAVRESIEDRIFTLDESRSADAATIRAAVDHIDSQERLVADQLGSLAEQIATSSAASDELWRRTTETLDGVETSSTSHAAAIEALAVAQRQLIERDDGNQERLAELDLHFGELRRSTEAVDQTLRSLAAASTDDEDRAPVLTDVIAPLSVAIDELAAQATEHRERLDAVGRSVDGFGDLGPRFEQSHTSLEQRIDALLDRQADLVASVRDLHPRFDALDEQDLRVPIGELLHRATVTESDLGVVGPKLEQMLHALERTEQRVTVQATTLDRVDERSEHLATAVAGLATSAERLERLDHLSAEIEGLGEAMANVDMPAVTGRLADLSARVDEVRDQVGATAASVLERIDGMVRPFTEGRDLLDQQPTVDARTEEQLSSLVVSTAEVANELGVLRGDLTNRHDEVQRQLDTIRSRSEGIAEASQHLVDADAGLGAGLEALGDRLDLLERRSTEADQGLNREIALIRTGLGAQLADLAGPITSITDQLAAMDLTQLGAQIDRTAEEQQRGTRDMQAAMAASAETSGFLRDALNDLSTRIATIDLEVVRTRLEAIEEEQRASEQRLASSLSSVHAVVDTFELEPVLRRLESLEVQSGESERSLLSAIAEVRNAAMSIDLGLLDRKISELEQRSRLSSDELAHRIAEVVTTVGQLDLSSLSESVAALDTRTATQREEVRAAIDELASGLDFEEFGIRLDALGRQAAESAATEAEVRTAVRALAQQLGDLDLQPISTRLDQLVDTVHATDEASRTSLASEIEAVSRRVADLDTERMSARLADLTGAQDRLSSTVETELAATVDRVRTAVADESESRLSVFTDAADQHSREIAGEIQALRDTVLDQFSEATAGQRQRLIERIDALGNTVVDRLDDSRVQTDSLAAQVTSIHAAFASSGPTSGDVRAHIDAALEGVTERIGGALRDLRREITDLGTTTETAGLRSAFEAGLERLGQRFDADIGRVLDAVADDADGDRLRRIDRTITEIRRDFEVLRRIGDQALPPAGD